MTKPIEELKEKARLTDEEINEVWDKEPDNTMGEYAHNLCKAQQDKDIQAFAEWCDKGHIVQVVEGELPLPIFENSRAGAERFKIQLAMQKDMLKWHKDSQKPVSSLLGGE